MGFESPLHPYCFSVKDLYICFMGKKEKEDPTTFGSIRDFINSAGIGSVITRKEIVNYIGSVLGKNYTESTIDNMRNYFQKAGYLKAIKSEKHTTKVQRGKYEVADTIPESITINQLLFKAYPNNPKIWIQHYRSLLYSLFCTGKVTNYEYHKWREYLENTDLEVQNLARVFIDSKNLSA